MAEVLQVTNTDGTSWEKEADNDCPPNNDTTEDPNADVRAVWWKNGSSLYTYSVGVMFFDISGIPAGATIESVSLRVEVDCDLGGGPEDPSRNFTVEWYDGANFPDDAGDYVYRANTFSNIAYQEACSGLPTSDTIETWTLSNIDFLQDRVGDSYIGFRTFVGGACPSGTNRGAFVLIDGPGQTTDPRLDITYTEAAVGGGAKTLQGPNKLRLPFAMTGSMQLGDGLGEL